MFTSVIFEVYKIVSFCNLQKKNVDVSWVYNNNNNNNMQQF